VLEAAKTGIRSGDSSHVSSMIAAGTLMPMLVSPIERHANALQTRDQCQQTCTETAS
jgi:phosphoribosylcarboxyaminoimidazole (NCAIR) mutase